MAIKFWQNKKTIERRHMKALAKAVPKIPGAYPLIGHGFQISKDFLGFLLQSRKKHGNVFCIQLFKWKTVIVGDFEIWKATTAASEEHLSFRGFNATLPVNAAIIRDSSIFTDIIKRTSIKKSLSFTVSMIPIIQTEAMIMVSKIKASQASMHKMSIPAFDVRAKVGRFVSNSLTQIILGFSLDSDGFETVIELNSRLKMFMNFSSVVPQRLLNFITKNYTQELSQKLVSILQVQLNRYRCDPNTSKIGFIGECLAYKNKETGTPLSDSEICRVVLTTMFYSGLETAVLLTNLIVELILNPIWLEEAKNECRAHVESGDFKGLLDSLLLEALVWESIRLYTNPISVVKAVTVKNVSVGGYNLGDADIIAASPRLVFETAGCTGLSRFDPTRFYGIKGKELARMVAILQFGAGPSFCPGKQLVLCQIKFGLAALLTGLNLNLERTFVSKQMQEAGLFLKRDVTAALNFS